MALITSAASGNFDAGATWVGGIVPGVGDEALASNGHTITITADVTCTELSNAGTGIYTLNSGVTLTANVTAKSTTINRNIVQFTAASPAVGFIVGNVTGATVSSNTGAVNNTSSGTLTITGNVTGGSGSTAFGCQNASTGTLTITGNVTGGSGSTAFGCQNASTGTLTITGNATGGSGGTAYGCNNNSTGTLTITGNATGGSANQAYGCNNNSTGTLAITGNATGGSGGQAFGCQNASTGTITITGIATGGTTNGAAGANNASSGTLNVGRAKGNDFGIGSTALVAGFGVTSAQASITKVKEIEYGLRGMSPTSGPTYLEPLLTNVAILVNYPSGSGSKTLSDPNNTAGLSPAATDVRTGVVYNNGVNTGTCAVPAAASVGFGVPVDATTGTAALTPASVWAYASRTITGGTVDTLTNAPTVPSAATIASQVRTELGTELGRIDAAVSSRLAPSGTLAVVTTLANAPTVPSAATIASQVRSELSVELGRVDAAITTRATPANIPAADITAIKAKTDALVTDRLAQCSTVATTGAQLAAALS